MFSQQLHVLKRRIKELREGEQAPPPARPSPGPEEQRHPLLGMGLMDAIPWVSPRFSPPRHLRPLVGMLERAWAEGGVFGTCHVPPQHHKSETVLHSIPWGLVRRPDWTAAYVTYAQEFSESKTLRAQTLCRNVGLTPDPRMANLREWRLPEGGGILTSSVDGPLTGQRVDVLLVDDPFKNRADAESPARQRKVWKWFEEVAETRLHPNSSVIVLHTRWTQEDLIGRIQRERPAYFHIRLPALADGLDYSGRAKAPDPAGRKPGEPLLPSQKSRAALEEDARLKPTTHAALNQGLPVAQEGAIFRPASFYTRRDLEELLHPSPRLAEDGSELPAPPLRRGHGLDLAYTARRQNDHSAALELSARTAERVLVTWGRLWQDRIEGTKPRLLEAQKARGVWQWRAEDNGPQVASNDTLEAAGVRLDRFTPTTDKYSRSLDYQEAWNAGRLLLPDPEEFPEHAEWVALVIEHHRRFTGLDGAPDDAVDAGNNAYTQLAELLEAGALQAQPQGSVVY